MLFAKTVKTRALALTALPAFAIALGLAPVRSVLAAPTVLSPTIAPLTSTAMRMISYREEDHSWQTADGAFHLLVNQGNQPDGGALQLYTTLDGGTTWLPGPTFENTNAFSTQDGALRGKTLAVVYSTSAYKIKFKSLVWDPVAKAWADSRAQTVFETLGQAALNPCIARDDDGNLWVPFVLEDLATQDFSIHMMMRPNGTNTWIDTGLTFGGSDNQSIERSAKPVAIPGGMGMVYTVHDEMYWATRDNLAPPTEPWTEQSLYTYTGTGLDPYASHWSLVTDSLGNIHLVLVDGGRVRYLHYDASTQTWSQRWLTSDLDADYPQISMVGNTLVIAVKTSTNARVFVSYDLGTTFSYAFALQHGPPPTGVSYRYPRLETAGYSTSPMLLFQQYIDNGVQGLLQYTVPVDPNTPPSP